MNGFIYAGLFLALLLIGPYGLAEEAHYEFIGYIASGVSALLLGVVMFRVHNDRMNLWNGLVRLSTSFMSGCANITLIYIFPVLAYYYLHAVVYTAIGFVKGKSYTEDQWCRLVSQRVSLYGSGRW